MISTIGYERAALPDFLATLKMFDVSIVVDIRDRAQSRRAGFSKSALSQALKAHDIGYMHLPELGDPKEGREAARRNDFDSFKTIFDEVMRTANAQTALAQLKDLSSKNNICLMCYERSEKMCHRKIVSDHLENMLGSRARHLGVREGAASESISRRVRDLN